MSDIFLNIHSSDRNTSGYPDSNVFNLNLSTSYSGIKKIELQSAIIPNTWYNINSYNNKLIFNEGALDITATLTNGSYNIIQLTAEIASKMTTASGVLVYTCTASGITQKVTITTTSNYILKFSNAGCCNKVIGFASVDTSNALTHTSDYAYDLNPIKSIYLDVVQFPHQVKNSVGDSHSFIIPIVSTSGYLTIFQNGSNFNQYTPSNPLDYLSAVTCTLKDQNNRLVDLNNAEWECVVKLGMQ
jgi:hypothetical protein